MLSRLPFPGWLKRLLKIALILLAILVLIIVSCIAFVEIRRHQTAALPAPTGPYAVGRVEYDWIDQARNDPLAPRTGTKRELVVWSWYPAQHVAGAHPAAYLPAKWAEASDNQIVQSNDSIQTHSFGQAPLATEAARYPVLIFEPGMGKMPAQYTTLLEDLASHGYIVFAITPTYSANTVVFPDGRVVESLPAGNPDDADKLHGDQLVQVWASDVSFVMDRLGKLNATPGNMFSGHLDLARLGVFGHSFGGATAAQVCHEDARCKAGIDLDGELFGDVVQAGLSKPFMVMQSEGSTTCTDASCQVFRDGIQSVLRTVPHGEGYHLSVKGTEHFNFSDYAAYFSLFRLFGVLGPIDGMRGVQITRAYVRAFFDTYLNGTPSPLLQGPQAAYPEVHFFTP